MTDESEDKTEECAEQSSASEASDEDITRKIREAAGDDGALGGSTDSDGGAILTLDGDSDSSDSEGESEGESGGEGS